MGVPASPGGSSTQPKSAAKQGYPGAALGGASPLHLLLSYKVAIYEKYKPAFPSLQPKRSYQVSGEFSSLNRLFGGCLQ